MICFMVSDFRKSTEYNGQNKGFVYNKALKNLHARAKVFAFVQTI